MIQVLAYGATAAAYAILAVVLIRAGGNVADQARVVAASRAQAAQARGGR